jgi:predicted aspartyl protease
MIKGFFVNTNIPVVSTDVLWGDVIQTPSCVLDTGFTGDLQITPEMAFELGLQPNGVISGRLANGRIHKIPVATAIAAMEGVTNFVEILISNSLPLLGTSFLEKFNYKVTADFRYKTVVLERV